MPKIYGVGVYDFRRHRVAEYPVAADVLPLQEKTQESKPGSHLPGSITLSEIQRDRLTKIAAENWLKNADDGPKKPLSPNLVKEIYDTELTVKEGRKPVPLQRVMILEVSQYLENYLLPNFTKESASFEHIMSMILMVNEKFRENVAAWKCFDDRKDRFKTFLEAVLDLKEGRNLSIPEKTNYLLFMINAFQSLEDKIVSESILGLASLECLLSLSRGRFEMELSLNGNLIKKWRRIAKNVAVKRKSPDSKINVKANFLRNLIQEFIEVLDSEVFSCKLNEDNDLVDASGDINDASVQCHIFSFLLI